MVLFELQAGTGTGTGVGVGVEQLVMVNPNTINNPMFFNIDFMISNVLLLINFVFYCYINCCLNLLPYNLKIKYSWVTFTNYGAIFVNYLYGPNKVT